MWADRFRPIMIIRLVGGGHSHTGAVKGLRINAAGFSLSLSLSLSVSYNRESARARAPPMAPSDDQSKAVEESSSMVSEAHNNKPISTIVIFVGVDCVGTVTASLVTYASIQALQPDLIINAGTAGGFKAKGASIGDVFLATQVAFHDRRIPIPVFDLYGVGLRKAFSAPNLVRDLNLKTGKLSTGDSLDMSPHDEASIIANDATLKDMEGAAVAYVADLLKVPVIFVKAVTDIVDGDKPSAEEFLQNLQAVTAALDESVAKVVDFINGKCLSDL
ncbi:hypothetical protein Cgig2_001871 [Carnegiea gigantea]|uniref:Nucleoside phosphorylase domain-containing protein n=1 Tax=Carnegiea gigantea TaxID=171969 RepID=A0A9Q1JZM5_9CARY|nr:hypothetical protein Cgig2_001871 [Carnegiea gigantea]